MRNNYKFTTRLKKKTISKLVICKISSSSANTGEIRVLSFRRSLPAELNVHFEGTEDAVGQNNISATLHIKGNEC